MLAYRGDLGLDDGAPQSVYALEKKGLDPVEKADGKPLRLDLAVGGTAQLPDGLGTVTFDGVSRYVKLQVSHTPGQKIALGGVVLGADRAARLAVHPARAGSGCGRVVTGGVLLVEVAGLDRSAGGDLSGEIDAPHRRTAEPAHGTSPEPEQESRRDPRAVRGAQQPGRGRLRRRLLPGRARPPRRSGRRPHGRGAGRGRGRQRRAPRPAVGGLAGGRSRRRSPATTSPSGWSCSAGSASR